MPELKVTQQHLKRDAYLYVRQSTPRQVVENTESTQRQYALRDRALALGWPLERIYVLDCDLGKSGSQSAGRDGFQKLVSEIALGKAGMVMGLEVSRLARNSADWHRLIETSVSCPSDTGARALPTVSRIKSPRSKRRIDGVSTLTRLTREASGN